MLNELPAWNDIINVCLNGQILLPQVKRWSRFRENREGTRVQDVLQHSYEAPITGRVLVGLIEPHLPRALDMDLLHTAFQVHDYAEGLTKCDHQAVLKVIQNDVDEYQAFVEQFRSLPPKIFDQFHRAFLLQFAHKDHARFPEEARAILTDHAANRALENLVFQAAEIWGYLLFTFEQYRDRGNRHMMANMLLNHLDEMDRLAAQLPGFKEVIWTPEIRNWATEFIKQNADLLDYEHEQDRARTF